MCSRPSVVTSHALSTLQPILDSCESWLFIERILSRRELIDMFGEDYAIHSLPADFVGARAEAIVYDQGFLIIGEYGMRGKRVAYVTKTSCSISDYYTDDPRVDHIHAVHKSSSSEDILVTTGDAKKVLDLWRVRDGQFMFTRRLRKRLAGYTAITRIRDTYYFGTDFSSRPNYIERLDRRKVFFPDKAYKMWVAAFQQYEARYILSISGLSFGGRQALSVFDTVAEEFIYCEYLDRVQPATETHARVNRDSLQQCLRLRL
jgi:hypothetical protein